MSLELRLLPLQFPLSPPQGMQVFANERFVGNLPLAAGHEWRSYRLQVPAGYLRRGINTFRFVYQSTTSPARVLPGSQNPRTLAVAFDYIAFRPQ